MSSRNRFVRVFFPDGGPPRYMPQEIRNGNLYTLDDENWPEVWGFGTPEAAQLVIVKIEKREAEAKIKNGTLVDKHAERCDCEACRPELYI